VKPAFQNFSVIQNTPENRSILDTPENRFNSTFAQVRQSWNIDNAKFLKRDLYIILFGIPIISATDYRYPR
jgi:hypothetical protein